MKRYWNVIASASHFPSVHDMPLPATLRRLSNRHAFSMIELIIVLTMMAALAAVSIGRTSRLIDGWRVARAAQSMTEEIQTGYALVGRNRKPLTIGFNTSTMELTFADRAGIIYRRRAYGMYSEYKLQPSDVTFSRTSVEVYPPGLAADTLSILIQRPGTARRVRMLRGGLTQICTSASTSSC